MNNPDISHAYFEALLSGRVGYAEQIAAANPDADWVSSMDDLISSEIDSATIQDYVAQEDLDVLNNYFIPSVRKWRTAQW